jgi:hypothetical protein
MIDILNRNLSFFRLLRNNKRIIESFDLDSGFASVIDYLNDVIVPAVNDMQAGALPGINGSVNYFLTNVGDGSVTFNTLDRVIPDKTLAFTKIEKAIANGKVLVSNHVGHLDLASGPTHGNMVLTYRNGDVPEYRFISTENIEDRAITYADIADGAINKEHLSPTFTNYLNAVVPLGTISGNQLGDFSITLDKIAAKTITTSAKLGYIPNILPSNPSGNSWWSLRQHIKNGVITANKIRSDTIGSRHFNRVKCITQNKLAANIVDESWLLPSPNSKYVPIAADNYFTNSMIAPDFKINRAMLLKSIPNNAAAGVRARDFVPHVQAAFNKFGCY